MLQKTDAVGFVKDTETNVVTNKSLNDYQIYIAQRNRALQMKHVEADINKLKQEMESIKADMQKIMAERNV
jgi:uncharacterized protein YpuA (DUF1002 family)